MFEKKIKDLKKMLLEEAFLAECMIRRSIKGLVKRNKALLNEVIKKDEIKLNSLEVEIDEACINLIALHQPKAIALRTIIMILKMNNDLERIGDLSVNIAESALYLIEREPVKPLIDIPRMAEISIGMFNDAINSFINKDINKAKEVLERDTLVDNLRDQILRELITFMIADPRTIERATNLIRISRAIERIADLSTNIAEDVIFMIKGKVIKHNINKNPD